MKQPTPSEIRRVMAALGRRTSEAKRKASQTNGRNAAAVARQRGKRVGRPPKDDTPLAKS